MGKFDILEIYRSRKTIFTTKDIALFWKETNLDTIKARVNYYVKKGKIYSPRKGIYAKDKDYERFELATRLYTPAYISLETVLQREGIIFQYYRAIFVVSYLSREMSCDGQEYTFRKIKDEVLHSPSGVKMTENYSIASKERAFLDALYLYQDYHFDNLSSIDWDMCFQILPVYDNRRLLKHFDSQYKIFKNA